MPIEFANFGDQKFVDKTQLFQTTKLYEGGSIWKGFQEISEKLYLYILNKIYFNFN